MSDTDTSPTETPKTTSKIDLAFLCDTTASMSGAIHAVQKHLKDVASEISKDQSVDLRLAAVEYKDHGDRPVTSKRDFTADVDQLKRTIDSWQATGGGDEPEAMHEGMHEAFNLSWREDATKLLVLCADAPPHGIGSPGDSMPQGSPNNHDSLGFAHKFAKQGVVVYTVGVNSPSQMTIAYLSTISYITTGRYLPLQKAESLPIILRGGAQEEAELDAYQDEVAREMDAVITERDAEGLDVEDEELIFDIVAKRLAKRGVKTHAPDIEQHGGGKVWEGAVEALSKNADSSSFAAGYGSIPGTTLAAAPAYKPTSPSYSSVPAYGAPAYGAPAYGAPAYGAPALGGYGSIPTAYAAAPSSSDEYACIPGAPGGYAAGPAFGAGASPAAEQSVGYHVMPISSAQVKKSMTKRSQSSKCDH